ncbi:MAG: alginate lyase family protein [Pseudomonadota bacterium]
MKRWPAHAVAKLAAGTRRAAYVCSKAAQAFLRGATGCERVFRSGSARAAAGVRTGLSIAVVLSGGAAGACARPPEPVRDLDLPRYYGDRAGVTIDAARFAAHQAAKKRFVHFVRSVAAEADRAWSAARPQDRDSSARCAVDWLDAWAAGGAYLGASAAKQAEYQRNWDAAGLALAFLKVRAAASPERRARISAWLRALAARARADLVQPGRKRNNHYYWLGLTHAAVAMAAEDPAAWAVAEEIYGAALEAIRPDGTLPLELERGSRALHYHLLAASPLVMTAELAAARGEDWYAKKGGALHRLTRLALRGAADPAWFEAQVGVAQARPVARQAGWARLYLKRFPDTTAPSDVKRGHRLLGGDVDLLQRALRRTFDPPSDRSGAP